MIIETIYNESNVLFVQTKKSCRIYILTKANRCQNKHHRANNDQTLTSEIYTHWFSKMKP